MASQKTGLMTSQKTGQAHGRPLHSTFTACYLCIGWATGRRRLAEFPETARAQLTQLPRTLGYFGWKGLPQSRGHKQYSRPRVSGRPCNAVSVHAHGMRCCLACPGDTVASRRHSTVPSVTADILSSTSYLPAKHRLP